jgi:hypothetical protein
VCLGDNCNTFVAQSFVSLVIKCVIGGLLVTRFNKVRGVGGGSKSDTIAFGGQLCCRTQAKMEKIGGGNQKIGIIRVVCTTFCKNSADYKSKRSPNHPDNTYLLIPSNDFFQS